VRFPFREVHDLESAQRNFEFLEQSGISWGVGAPTAPPSGGIGIYLRHDTPTVANQLIYKWTGSAWTGVL
jgi:hypothetical protein